MIKSPVNDFIEIFILFIKLDLTGTYCKSKLFDNTWEPSLLFKGIICKTYL